MGINTVFQTRNYWLFLITLILFSFEGQTQTINISFDEPVSVCNDEIVLNLEIINDTGAAIDNGEINTDLLMTLGLVFQGTFNQISGPTLTNSMGSVFSFSDPLADNESIIFSMDLSLDCAGSTEPDPSIEVIFDFSSGGIDSEVTEILDYVINAPDIDITSSSPNGISGVIGFNFSITNTVVNNGNAEADSVFYCIQDNPNASILSIEVGGTSIAPHSSTIAGSTCFFIGSLLEAESVDVIENWVITSCDAPQDLFRRASYGCFDNLDCAMDPGSEFPSTILTLVAPTDPLSISISNASELFVCGESDVVCISIENNNGDDYTTQNAVAALSFPAGITIDYTTLTSKSGPPISHIAGTDSIAIGAIMDGEIAEFSVELSIDCTVTESAVDLTVDVVYDELCEGVNNMAKMNSSQISVLQAEFSILSPLIEGNLRPQNIFDAILGVPDTIKVPLVNAGAGSIDEFTYWVINPGSVDNLDVLINGMSLTPAGINGDTVFYTVTTADIMSDHGPGGNGTGNGDGLLDENELLFFCEVWVGTTCDLGTPNPIQRAARYGCGGITVCNESNIAPTGIDFGFALPDLIYSEYEPLIDRPACWSEENTTLAIEVINEGVGIAQDIIIDLRQGNDPGAIIGGSLMWSLDPAGPFMTASATNTSPATGTIGSSGQCVARADAFRNVDALIEDVNLVGGDTLYFTYQLEHGCDCRACSVDNIYGSRATQMQWTDPCGVILTNNDDIDFLEFDARLQGFFEGESNISGSGCIEFAVTSGFSRWMSADYTADYPDAYFESRISIECGIDLVSAQLLNSQSVPINGLTITQNTDNGAAGDDEVIFQINRNFAGFIEICFDVDCSEKPTGCPQLSNLSMENFFFPDPSCAASCEPNVNCTQDFNFVFNCPPCGPCDGLTSLDLQIERTNYCLLDADNDFIADDGVTLADASTAKGDRFVQGDSLKVSISGVVNDNNANLWEYGFLEFNTQTTNFSIIGAEYTVYDESADAYLTCNTLSQFPVGSLLVTDLSVPSMTGLGCNDFMGFQYEDGDSLFLCVYFSPKEELFNVQSESIVYQPDFYLSDDAYDIGNRFSCNFLIETMNQIGIRDFESIVIGGRDFGGCDISPFVLRYDLNYGNLGFDEFCNEIRSPGIPEKFTFIKPTELEYSLDDFGLDVWQRLGPDNQVVNMDGGGIPANFFLESGDTLCFFVKDYLLSLNLPEISEKGTDGGYNIYFYPGIRGNCLSEIQDYEACGDLLTDVNDQVFCQDKLQSEQVCEMFSYTGGPSLIVSAASSEVELFEPMACVDIELNNVSNINAPFSWLNINSITGGMVITSVIETTGGASNLLSPTSFGQYELGTTSSASTRTFQVCVNVTDCNPQTLEFTGGWDCVEYPTTVQEATCNDPSTIDFVSVESAYSGQLIKPVGPVEYDLCDTVCFIHRFSSTNLGNVNDILFDFKLPTGMDYVPGSFEIAYPVPPANSTDTIWTFVMDPDNYADNNHLIDVTSLDSTLDNVGLIGSLGAIENTNIVLVRWNAVTTCDYIAGSRARFVTTANDLCGDGLPTIRSRSPRLRIRDLFPDYDIDLALNDLTLNPCNEDGATVEIELTIDAESGIETSSADSLKITLPVGITYTSMSYVPINNASSSTPIVTVDNGAECVFIPIEEGLSNGDVVNFTIEIQSMDVGQICGSQSMLIQTFSATNADCDGETCSIGVLSGEDEINIRIDKPDLSILYTNLTLVSMPPNSAAIEYEMKIMNNGLVDQEVGNDLVIEFWDDVNDNGLLDQTIDQNIVAAISNVLIPAGGMTVVTGTVPVPPTGICNALAVLNPETACVCSLEVSNQTQVEIENEFDMEVSVCSDTPLEIGPEPVNGFDYQWLSVNGSDVTALSQDNTTTVDIQFDNNSGSDIVWEYSIRSSFGNCFTYDTIEVTIFKEEIGTADVPGCEGDELELPGPVGGSNFMWSPTTDLDDPTSAFPILSPVPSGTRFYEISYLDDNGCAATKEVNVIGGACAPGTAIGDTVWFDFNENGMQEAFEPGIPNVIVYLYNANNTTFGNHIAVTMTDANGFYIFDNLQAGNYIVGFDMPAGFVYTTIDTGNDSLDSDADPGTGLTGPYFLPNGTFNPTVDAGFIPDCLIEVDISSISECLFDGSTHTREVVVDITWNNAVYTYDFLGGLDTIQLDILGQTFQYEINQLNGDTSQVVIIDNATPVDLLAEVQTLINDDCIAFDEVLDIQPCIYDLALIKQVVTPGPYSYGDILTYEFTLANQGFQDLMDIKINDFLPTGFVFDPLANPDWMQSATDTLMFIYEPILTAGETVIIPLDLELVMSSDIGAYFNTAEIFSFTDTLGVDRSDEDIDSSPDNDPSNDGGGLVNSGSDNSLDGDGSGMPGDTNPNTDEDDEDPELITIVDLALVKDIITPGPYNYGDVIEFEITVVNQGNVTAQNIKVNDYIPAGFAWDTSNEPEWMLMGNVAMDTIPGPIATGESASTTISLILQMADPSEYVNIAEIGYFENEDGDDITGSDIDSDADNDPSNDAGGNPDSDSDGVLNGDGTGAPQDTDPDTDEDDSDPAYIAVPLIDLEKTTIGVVPAQSGIPGNFDATYEFVITNPGNQKLTCIQLQDDLTEQLGGTYVGITSAPMITPLSDATEIPSIVMGYNGGVIDTIFNGSQGCLNPGETITVQMTIELNSQTGGDPIINEGDVSGKSPDGFEVMDQDTAVVVTPNCFLVTVCPIDQVELNCIADIPADGTTAAWFNGLDGISSIVSSCGVPTIVVNDMNNGGMGCSTDPYILTRQIIINDPGDGTSTPESDTCQVVYTVIDDDKPIVMNEAFDLVVECGVDNTTTINNWIMNNGGGVFVDDCGSVTNTFVAGTPVAGCGSTSITSYTFTATDACDNSISVTANLIIEDTTDPALILPTGSASVSCDAGPDPDAWAATATAMDDCDASSTVNFALINTEEICNGTNTEIIYTYFFTAVDDCGNQSVSETATYTVFDNIMPSITPPSDLMITCGQDLSLLVTEWLDDYTVMDNCSDATELIVTQDFDASMVLNACGQTIPVTWTIVDACNATNTATANIIISNDTEGPMMNCVPTLTYALDVDECESNITLPLPTATDCNGVDSIVQVTPLVNSPFPIGMTTVTFYAWDGCGNTSSCTTIVEIVDTQNPELICPSSINQCADTGSCEWISDGSVNAISSDCTATTLTYTVENPDGSISTPAMIEGYVFQLGSSIVNITATQDDDMSNTSSCNFTVTIVDCEAPVITTCPTNELMIECGMEDVESWAATLTGTDHCTTNLNTEYYLLSQSNSCGATTMSTYVFTVTDEAGNSATCQAVYNIVDTTMPTIDVEATNPVENCMEGNDLSFIAWLESNGAAEASDGCGEPLTWSNDWNGTIPTGCSGMTTITVSFTATDECGNAATTDGVFTITDMTPPTISAPADLVLECAGSDNEGIVANWLTTASTNDDCSEVSVINNYSSLPATCNTPVVVTFTATDACANVSTATATITLVDTQKPIIMAPPVDLIVDCSDPDITTLISDWEADFGGGIAVDNCDANVTITFIPAGPTVLCGGSSDTQYTFTAEDDCGNLIVEYANLIITDSTGPMLTLPTANNTAECDADVDGFRDTWLASASAIDACGGMTSITYNTPLISSACAGMVTTITETFTFTSTDECGNVTTGQADFIIEDNTAPTIAHNEGDLTLSCGDNIAEQVLSWLQDYTTTESCQETTVSNDYDGALLDLCGDSQTITWTVTDLCGAVGTTSAMIIISPDTTDPTFVNISDDITLNVDIDNCSSNVVFSTPSAIDCNEPVTVTQIANADGILLMSGSEFPVGTTTVVFQAEDNCGNLTTESFDITIVDSQIPVIGCPSNDVVQCNDIDECFWTADTSTDAAFVDNCGDVDISYVITGATTATGDSLPRLDNVQFLLGTSTVSYTLLDSEGNASTCSFDVVVEDCEAPIVTCPLAGDLVLECADPDIDTAIAAWIATASVDDNCMGSSLTNEVASTTEMCGDSEIRTYSFTATDASGNTSVCFANVIIEDTSVPTIDTDAEDLMVECDGEGNNADILTWVANNGGAIASDLCGIVTWENDFTGLSDLCGLTGTALVTFTASDECGNTSSTQANFTITDGTVPTVLAPSPISLSCNDLLNEEIIMSWMSQASGSDNCSDVEISNSGLGTILPDCGMSGVYTVTFTATDACGNTSTENSTVTIIDETGPTITQEPTDLVLECTASADYTADIMAWTDIQGGALAEDGCSEPIIWTFTVGIPISECGGTSTTPYTFIAEDDCGNTTSITANFVIVDNTAPELTLPMDITVDCEDPAATTVADWISTARSMDICGSTSLSEVLWNTISECGETSSTVYLFTAEDECGNQTTGFATYTVEDQTLPTITAPSDLMITCGEMDIATQIVQWLDEAVIADGCNTPILTTDYNGDLPNACGGTIPVVFTVSDGCGNLNTDTANIIYTDDVTAPIFINAPSDITVNVDVDNCESNIVFSTPIAEDCNGPVTTVQVPNAAGLLIASGDEFPLGTTSVMFESTDACGNTSMTSFTITVIDSQLPTIGCPSNMVVQCVDLDDCVWSSDMSVDAIFNDNCMGFDLAYTVTGATTAMGDSLPRLDGVQFELGLSTIVYTLTDVMGNVVSCEFDVLIEDCQAPEIICPINETVECSSLDNATELNNWLAEVMGSDNCDLSVSFTSEIWNTISGCGNTNTTTYLFTATDQAGNTTTCLADFTIEDTTLPVITADPDDTVVECDGSGNNAQLLTWLQNNGGLTDADVTEGCGAITWNNNFSDLVFISNDPCSDDIGFYDVEFTATDECGNESDAVNIQFIIEDTTDPILSIPNDITLSCNEPTNSNTIQNWLAEASAFDLCSDVVVTNDAPGVFVPDCASTGVTTYTFVATDDCGNSVSDTATITIEDTSDPEIIVEPTDLVVECNGAGNNADLTAWLSSQAGIIGQDVCSEATNLVYSNELRSTVNGCGGSSAMTYAFIVTDECGNSSESLATFTIQDTTSPTIDILPENQVVECDGAGNNVALEAWLDSNGNTGTASDICGMVTWTHTLIDFTDDCGTNGTKIYEFIATDECGNTNTAQATFVIEDTTPPVVVCCPDFSINLDMNGIANIDIDDIDCGTTDQCNDASQLIRSISQSSFNASNVGPNNVTLFVTDACGNVDSCTVIVTVEEMPSIGVAKRVADIDFNDDGCTEIVYEINVENFGDVTISSLQVTDDLQVAGFGACASYTSTLTSDDFTVNPNFNGSSDINLLTGGDDIPAGDVGAILLTIETCGCPDGTEISNSATVSGESPGGDIIMDDSVNGSDPDGDDNDNDPDESGTTDTTLEETGSIGAAKRVVSLDLNEDGCTEVVFEINIENFGTVDLDEIQVTDDLLAAGFGTCDDYMVSLTSDDFIVNEDYNGNSDINLLVGTDDLPVGDIGAILLTVDACGCPDGTEIMNSATVSGNTPGGDIIMDDSVSGSDPDGDDNDNDPDESGTTDLELSETGSIGAAKRVVTSEFNEEGCTEIVYEINIENFGNVDIDQLQAMDDLEAAGFGMCDNYTVSLTSDDFIVNTNFDGSTDTNLLKGTDDLPVGDVGAILLTVEACSCPNITIMNSVTISGTTPGGDTIMDDSVDGADPDGDDNDGNPDESGTTNTTINNQPSIGLAKRVVSLTNNSDGSADVTFEFNIENLGNVVIDQIQVTDDLLNTFDPCTDIEILELTSDAFVINPLYDGETVFEMLEGNNSIAPMNVGAIILTINVDGCGGDTGPFENQAELTGVDPNGDMVMDLSQDGADADPDNDGNAGNNNDPTIIDFEFEGMIGASKRVSEGPILSTEGCYDITFEINVQNFGTVDLSGIQVTEDLTQVFDPADMWSIVSVESEEFEVNTNFDGMTDINLLTGNDVLISEANGDNGAIYLTVNVCPSGNVDEYFNSVTATGMTPSGEMVSDVSTDGSSPDPDSNNDPSDNDVDTGFQLDCEIPMFTNCPRPNIMVDAPEGWCNSFVNFSPPTATAECGLDTIIQVDNTGLSSGDLFPVGTTILQWVALDVFGNPSDTCEIKITVNDFHTPPTISCPTDLTFGNDPAMCGAIVNDIAPFDIVDNCPDNIVVNYTLTDEAGNIIDGGIDDASGLKFPQGTTTVTYTVADQPLLLITEISNDGIQAGVEISNFGPATMDISCMNVGVEGATSDEFNVPNGTILAVGDVYTIFFYSVDPLQEAGYTISMFDNQIDGVAVNGYTPLNWSFNGSLVGQNIFRSRYPDTDSFEDWSIGNSCAGLSFGMYNPELPVFEDNGTISSLQGNPPSLETCSFTVTILDEEAPNCAELIQVDYLSADTPLPFTNGACATSIINVTDVFNVSDVNILSLTGNYPDMSEVSITLTSPSGTVVSLFEGLCAGTADWNINLDDQATDSQASIVCSPLGNGQSFQALNSMEVFFGEPAFGDWQLDVYATGIEVGQLSEWTLQLSELAPYGQMDVEIFNDPMLCGANYEWQHPLISDNCAAGSLSVEYILQDESNSGFPVPINIEPGSIASEFFAVGTTQVVYTLTDAEGNSSQCAFDITVTDNEPPSLADSGICDGIVINLGNGQCDTQVPDLGGIPIDAFDNCGIDSVFYNPPVGFDYPIGTTATTIIIKDAAGNVDSCTFDVVVNEFDTGGNTALACNGGINLSLGPDCMAELTADMILEGGNYGCYDDFCIEVTNSLGQVVDNIFDLSDVGQSFTVSISDCLESGNSCWGIVNIEEKLIPEIICAPDTLISCNMATHPEFTGYPEVITCEQDLEMTYFDDYIDFGPCGEPRARIIREWTIIDESSNIVNCTQTIDIEQFDVEDIDFPLDYTIETGLDCAEVALFPHMTHPDSTGYPQIDSIDVPLSANGLCMLSWNWDDQILFSCAGSYEILRTWFVRDMCEEVEMGVNPIEHYQIIKIIDNEGPYIHDCPDDIIVSTDPWSCTGTYELGDIISSMQDNCGGIDQVQVSVNGGTVIDNLDGTFTITNMDIGDHLVRIRARDFCYNTSSCEFTIHVLDQTQPTVICKEFINVSLTDGGFATMSTAAVDAGSYDNCSDTKLELYRLEDNCNGLDTIIPAPFVEFCCADVEASPIMVAMLVWDDGNMDGIIGNEGDNSNVCMIEVTVEDKLPPSIVCPLDITITCDSDPTDLSIVGVPTIFGSCSSSEPSYFDEITPLNDCGAAIIERTWSPVSNPEITCTQMITLTSLDPFDGNILWPEDWEGACLDDIPQEEPIFVEGACDQVAFTVETDTFNFVENVCYKLVKEWTVIDWCQYDLLDPNGGGIWTFTQTIKINDETAPEFETCEDITVEITSENCIEDISINQFAIDTVCGINAPLVWSFEVDLGANGIWDYEIDYTDDTDNDLEGNEVTAIIEDAVPGEYRIRWETRDGCGNVKTCTQNITVVDGKAPTPYCLSGISTAAMQQSGSVEIWASDFNIASFDNCTNEEELLFSFSGDEYEPSRLFTCDDIPNGVSEPIDLEMWVWDEAGNADFCSVTLEIIDNFDVCQDTSSNTMIISGMVQTEDQERVEDVRVTLESYAPEYPYTTMTNDTGQYYFLYNPMEYDFVAKGERDTDYLEGVTTLDIVMIQRHILGLDKLDSPYKIIAGDANNNQSLSALDLISIRKVILGLNEGFENQSWRFVDAKYEFIDWENPWPFDETVNVNVLSENVTDANLIAVKIGDVNQSASPGFSTDEITRTRSDERMLIETEYLDGKTILNFYAESDQLLYGFQFSALLDKANIIGFKNGNIEINPNMIAIGEKAIRMSWNDSHGIQVNEGDILFSLISDSKEKIDFQLNDDDVMVSEIYVDGLEQKNLKLEWMDDEFNESFFSLLQNEPNPFNDKTAIRFIMPEDGNASFTISLPNGKLIYTLDDEYRKGENVILISKNEINHTGIMFYEISGNGFYGKKKMIILD